MDAVIYLARHGETDYNVQRRFQGQGDVPLNARGREQAAELAANAAQVDPPIAALYCSPLPRALETAAIVGAALGLEPIADDAFRETDTGDWTDRLFADVQAEQPELYGAYHATDPDFAFPGGESLEEQLERVVDGLVDVTQAGVLPALIVCHRGVIRCARSHTAPQGLATFMSWDVPNGTLETL